MLGEGGAAGILVPHQDPTAIGRALREILSETNRAAWASRAASGSGSSASWPIVAQRYRELARKLTRTRVAA
jgi:glycogen synthase